MSARMMLRGVLIVAIAGCAPTRADDRDAISTADAHAFAAALSHWTIADSTCLALEPYWRAATPGFRSYSRKFDVGDADLCRAIRRNPTRYARVAAKLDALDSAATIVRALYAKFDSLRPLSNHPAVYFVVGNGISAGSTTRGRHPIILIGTELIDNVAHLPRVVAHELVHTQQNYPFWGSMTGGPSFLRGSLLRVAITEGSADFIASLLTGRPDSNAWAEAHENELWAEFQREDQGRDYSRWLYNGWNQKALGERPHDIGYWVGYRISQSYYERATDKRRAIAEILTIRDFDVFLRASGYAGGAPGRLAAGVSSDARHPAAIPGR